MKIFKKILIFLLSIVLLSIVFIFFYFKHLEPTYKGELSIKNLKNPVEIYYDSIGVPHIYAKNQKDAYTALGYAHAQDRLWQMELLRRIGAGRLSEIFGKDKNPNDNLFLKTDKFFLGMGLEDAGKRSIAKIDVNSKAYQYAMAYLDGVNQFIEKGPTPIEYTLIGIKKEKFDLVDMYNVFGYMSFSFAMAHKTDPLMTSIREKLGDEYVQELGVIPDSNTTLIPNYNPKNGIESNLTTSVTDIMNNLPVSPFIGSNAWVVGPEKTKSGKVIFTNDPHINYSQPAVWYQSHLVCPDYEIYGFHLGLTAFPFLAHNRNYAYGLTMFENDDLDFYKEELNPNNPNEYKVDTTYVAFKEITKTVKIKGGTTETFKVKISKHGAIMNDFIETIQDKEPIAMDWVYTKFDNEMLVACYEISHANNIDEFKNGVSKIYSPGLNVMYGDAVGNYAWFAAGKLYKHQDGVNPKFILDGANGKDDKVTYIPFSDNPQAINSPEGYVYSANNQPSKLKTGYYPGYYLPKDRAKRIVDELTDMEDIEVMDMQVLVTDITSSVIPNYLPKIVNNISEKNLSKNEEIALKTLRIWDGSYELDQVAPTIFTLFRYNFMKNTFQDELGKKGFEQFLETHIAKSQFQRQIEAINSIWDDDITTPEKEETKRDIITKSFKETVTFLEKQHGNLISKWKWKKVHTVIHEHPIGTKLSFLGLDFNVGPFAISGGNSVLNNQISSLNPNGIYKVTGGPSTRRIVDFNDVENSVAIIPTGQSGNVFSKHYKNQAEKFVNGEFYKMLINKSEILKLEDKLILKPE